MFAITVVCLFIKAIKRSATFAGDLVNEACLLDEVHLLDSLTEVALIDFMTYYCLIYILKLCQGEQVGKQIET